MYYLYLLIFLNFLVYVSGVSLYISILLVLFGILLWLLLFLIISGYFRIYLEFRDLFLNLFFFGVLLLLFLVTLFFLYNLWIFLLRDTSALSFFYIISVILFMNLLIIFIFLDVLDYFKVSLEFQNFVTALLLWGEAILLGAVLLFFLTVLFCLYGLQVMFSKNITVLDFLHIIYAVLFVSLSFTLVFFSILDFYEASLEFWKFFILVFIYILIDVIQFFEKVRMFLSKFIQYYIYAYSFLEEKYKILWLFLWIILVLCFVFLFWFLFVLN
jgi:hypothetical protein